MFNSRTFGAGEKDPDRISLGVLKKSCPKSIKTALAAGIPAGLDND